MKKKFSGKKIKRGNVAVIGGGIHGIAIAIALAENGANVVLLEKKQGLLQATSGATNNRAHLGYHYPRSMETAIECLKGLKYFKMKYPQALYYPPQAYYVISKHGSKIKPGEFISFCKKVGIPCKIQRPSAGLLARNLIGCSFLVPEPIFNLRILTNLLGKEILEKGVYIKNGSEVTGIEKISGDTYRLTTREGKKQVNYTANVIINATYAYSNNVLRALGLKQDMTSYYLQTTEVVVAKTKKDIPALTIMDGPFMSIMPYAGYKNHVLVYDVTHSVAYKEEGYFCDDSKVWVSNWKKMVECGKKYFPFMDKLEYVRSLWGYRPIPTNDKNECRRTRLKIHSSAPGLYSILEGKFISAPLMARELVKIVRSSRKIMESKITGSDLAM